MLERERSRKELSTMISRRVMPMDDLQSQNFGSDMGDSHVTNDSMKTYYQNLLAPRQDDVAIARKRLENLKALADARTKLLKMNDTICDAESTLMEAYRHSSSEGLSLSSVKFRKVNALNGYSPRSSIAHPNHHIHEEHGLNMSSLTPRTKSTFIVEEKILRTIEHSIKGKESKVRSLEQELGHGLGLMKVSIENTSFIFAGCVNKWIIVSYCRNEVKCMNRC
jgi:hypothetical protein